MDRPSHYRIQEMGYLKLCQCHRDESFDGIPSEALSLSMKLQLMEETR